MYIIGLTGGIACGKSSVAEIFRKFGATTFDVDTETHKLLQCGESLYSAYVQHFGNIIVEESGQINKKLVAEIIFNNESERLWINSVAHPILLNRTRDFLVDCANNGVKLVVLEIPLLFEAGWEILVDEVWAVYISKGRQLWRLMQRDGLNWVQASIKIKSQMSAKEIADRADVVINNKNPGFKVRQQVIPLIEKMLSSL